MKGQLNFLFGTLMVIFISLSNSSCGSDTPQTRYVAAKLVDSDMWSIVDVNSGEVIHKDEFKSQPSVIVNKIFCVKNESGLYDYFSVDDVTKPINKESFLYATSFSDEKVALAVKKGKGICIIDEDCNVVAELDNAIISATDFSNGYSAVANDDNKYGYINKRGEIIIKPSYDSAADFSKDGIAIVAKEVNDSVSKFSAIDVKGEVLFSFSSTEYKDYGDFLNGYLPVKKDNDEVVLLDKEGKKHTTLGKWKGFIPLWLGFNDGVIVFKDGDSYGLKNEKGDIVIRAKYDELIPLTMIKRPFHKF